MLRKSAFLILGLICIFSVQLGFAATQPVTADQIIISEPTNEKMTNDKPIYVSVNIVNAKVAEQPIFVSLVRVDKKIQFVDELSSDLKISVMKLSHLSVGELDKATYYATSQTISAPQYSEGYKKETQIINRFFELKDIINISVDEFSALTKKYRFDLVAGNADEIAKLNTETYELYKKWSQLKSSIYELRKEFNQIQVQYASYYEKLIVQDVINKSPNYWKDLGKLPLGEYKLRFIDGDQQLIKEYTFQIIEKVESIKPIETIKTIETTKPIESLSIK